jgi:hypothetical protein
MTKPKKKTPTKKVAAKAKKKVASKATKKVAGKATKKAAPKARKKASPAGFPLGKLNFGDPRDDGVSEDEMEEALEDSMRHQPGFDDDDDSFDDDDDSFDDDDDSYDDDDDDKP